MLIFSNPMATILFPLTRTQWYLPMALPLVSCLFMQPIHRLLSKIVILLTLIIRAMVKHLQCLLNKVNIPNPVCQSTWPQPTLQGKPHMSRKPTRHDCLGLLSTSSICLSTTQSWTTPFSFLISSAFPDYSSGKPWVFHSHSTYLAAFLEIMDSFIVFLPFKFRNGEISDTDNPRMPCSGQNWTMEVQTVGCQHVSIHCYFVTLSYIQIMSRDRLHWEI